MIAIFQGAAGTAVLKKFTVYFNTREVIQEQPFVRETTTPMQTKTAKSQATKTAAFLQFVSLRIRNGITVCAFSLDKSSPLLALTASEGSRRVDLKKDCSSHVPLPIIFKHSRILPMLPVKANVHVLFLGQCL